MQLAFQIGALAFSSGNLYLHNLDGPSLRRCPRAFASNVHAETNLQILGELQSKPAGQKTGRKTPVTEYHVCWCVEHFGVWKRAPCIKVSFSFFEFILCFWNLYFRRTVYKFVETAWKNKFSELADLGESTTPLCETDNQTHNDKKGYYKWYRVAHFP